MRIFGLVITTTRAYRTAEDAYVNGYADGLTRFTRPSGEPTPAERPRLVVIQGGGRE